MQGRSILGTLGFWRDSAFWCALIAAPICWLLLAGTLLDVSEQPQNINLLFWSVLVYPVLEEIVFRGGLQSMLLDKTVFARQRYGISLANLVTSVLFAAMHLYSQAPLWAALVFLPSLIFGAARDRYEGIAASIVLHVFYNAGFIALFIR